MDTFLHSQAWHYLRYLLAMILIVGGIRAVMRPRAFSRTLTEREALRRDEILSRPERYFEEHRAARTYPVLEQGRGWTRVAGVVSIISGLNIANTPIHWS